MSIKNYLQSLYKDAEDLNTENVKVALSSTGPHQVLLDVGCWDGVVTMDWKKSARAEKVLGIEPVNFPNILDSAREKEIDLKNIIADKDIWPIDEDSVDCIVSNQVIEHLTDVDHFFSESYRVLKKGGYIVTSTNNLASIHNIGSLIFGFAPFDLTNSSKIAGGIGNPIALHRGEKDPRGSSWTHKCIYTVAWLKEWQKLYDLEFVKSYGAGLYPLPASVGKYIKLYSAFITVVCKKI